VCCARKEVSEDKIIYLTSSRPKGTPSPEKSSNSQYTRHKTKTTRNVRLLEMKQKKRNRGEETRSDGLSEAKRFFAKSYHSQSVVVTVQLYLRDSLCLWKSAS
jgi:hypothetical protein